MLINSQNFHKIYNIIVLLFLYLSNKHHSILNKHVYIISIKLVRTVKLYIYIRLNQLWMCQILSNLFSKNIVVKYFVIYFIIIFALCIFIYIIIF